MKTVYNITVSRREAAEILVEVEEGTDPATIDKRTLARGLDLAWTSDPWDSRTLTIEGARKATDEEIEDFPAMDGTSTPSMEERALEIGVRMRTLATWKSRGVDIWNDDSVRRYIANQKRINFSINPKFQFGGKWRSENK